MRRATLALVLLGLVACVSAGDVSRPKPISGRLSCVLPISKLTCIRDWRSGFVAGLKYSFDGFDGLTYQGNAGTPPSNPSVENWVQVCSPRIFNQTTFDMSVPSQIDSIQSQSPAWYNSRTLSPYYLYPRGSPITQVIVLTAPNPWGEKFGNIAAILFGYLSDDTLDFAVCGNALYAQYYLNPGRYPAPPTPVTLKQTFTSSLSEDDVLTALGGFEGKCGTRGTQFSAYLGGDPWRSSKFRLKSLIKPCFAPATAAKQTLPPGTPVPPQRILGHYHCDEDKSDEVCKAPCHWDKKNSKKSASFSCAMSGTAIATGKYGAIMFDKEGNKYDWDRDEHGNLRQVKAKDDYEPEAEYEEEDEKEYDH